MANSTQASLQTRLIKMGARVACNALSITLQLAGAAISGDIFTRILAAIYRLRALPVPA